MPASGPSLAEAIKLHQAGRFASGEILHRQVLERAPHIAEAHAAVGVALLALNRFGEAAARCEKSLVLRPDYAAACSNPGIALQSLGRRSLKAILTSLRSPPRWASPPGSC